MKVTNLNDLLLYFTASDIILSDFQHDSFKSYHLVLRPWINIHPASEFRCIIINNVLRGISPRDWPTYYEHFKEEGPSIIKYLTKFFNENVKGKFNRSTCLSILGLLFISLYHYFFLDTFDVVTIYENDIMILDFGPLNSKSKLYAFSWKEIQPLMNKVHKNR